MRGLNSLNSLQTTSFNHRLLRSNLGKVVILQINPLQVSLLQFPQPHRSLRRKIFNLVLHLEMVIMRLGGLNSFQINLLQVSLLRFATSHHPLCRKMINPCTVVIHLKMITMRLGGFNPLSHHPLRRKVVRVWVGVIIYVEEMRSPAIYHQFTLRPRINCGMEQWLSYTCYHYLFCYKYQTMLFDSCTKEDFVMYLITGCDIEKSKYDSSNKLLRKAYL